MYRYRWFVNFVVFIIITAVAFNSEYNPFVMSEPNGLSQAAKTVDELYNFIKDKSDQFSETPQNAYIDDVWKKTPGRNGLLVNVDDSYEKMKKEGVFEERLLVYEQESPEVSLNELPASPIFRGHPEKEMVAFLINVSWGTEYIPEILNILKENTIKATFFIEGKWAKDNAELVKMIDEQGHVIGNHAYNHPDMVRLSNQNIVEQISQTNEIIEAIVGETPKWFAPPGGSFNDQVVQAAHHLKMETILWTVDTIDWKNPSVSVMINRVNSKIHPGATILMHPTPSIANGLNELIKQIKDKDYKISTIENLLSEER